MMQTSAICLPPIGATTIQGMVEVLDYAARIALFLALVAKARAEGTLVITRPDTQES